MELEDHNITSDIERNSDDEENEYGYESDY
jgi:hypothetical protein